MLQPAVNPRVGLNRFSQVPEVKQCPGIEISRRGAGNRVRTDDLLITNQLLYQLSYAGIYEGKASLNSPLSRAIVPPICTP